MAWYGRCTLVSGLAFQQIFRHGEVISTFIAIYYYAIVSNENEAIEPFGLCGILEMISGFDVQPGTINRLDSCTLRELPPMLYIHRHWKTLIMTTSKGIVDGTSGELL